MARFFFRFVLLVLVVLPPLLALGMFQREPSLPANATLDPRVAVKARGLALRARAALAGPGDSAGLVRIAATEAELNSALATAARFVRPLRGDSRIDDTGVRITASAQVPGLPGLGWINLRAQAAPSESGLDIVSLRLGHLDLPPSLTMAAAVRVLDLVSADDTGTALWSGVAGLRTMPGRAELVVRSGGGDGPSLLDRLADTARGLAGIADTAAVARHYGAMADAAGRGALPASGSTLPWVRFAVTQVADAGHATPAAARADLRAAFIALGAHCGDRSITERLIGGIEAGGGTSACARTTLGGRRDLRQHFTLSAALAAMGGGSFSLGLGEMKELLDAGRDGGSGYSFDDLAFDMAGMRFALRALDTLPTGLGLLAARLVAEDAVVPVVDDLPTRLSDAEFARDFGTVDSPAYTALVARIDARIEALPVHAVP